MTERAAFFAAVLIAMLYAGFTLGLSLAKHLPMAFGVREATKSDLPNRISQFSSVAFAKEILRR